MGNKTNDGAAAPHRMLGAAIVAVVAFVLLGRFTGSHVFDLAAVAAMGAAFLASVRRLGWREAYLGAIAILLTALLVATADEPGRAISRALDQAAFLMAFIYLLTLLHETASRSPSISACGAYLAGQPAGRRYGALFWGSNVMAVLFNLGVVSLLTPLVQKGLAKRALPPDLKALSERRQINALLRGFSFNVVWSPTALAPLAILELIRGVDRGLWSLLGFALTALIFVAGWLDDRRSARALAPRAARAEPPPAPPRSAGLGFLAVVASLFALVWAISWAAGETIAAGLMLACPILSAAWLWAQTRGARPVLAAMSEINFSRLPRIAPVAATLALSGYLGRVAAELTPGAEIADALDLYGQPDWIILAVLPPLLALCSFFGVSPIMLAVFFGSLFGSLPEAPADPTMIALAISCGWALAMLVSPFATIVMLLAQQTGARAITVALGRNAAHALAAAILMAAFFWAVETARLL